MLLTNNNGSTSTPMKIVLSDENNKVISSPWMEEDYGGGET